MFILTDMIPGGEREIQQTMLELLNQLDDFDMRGHVSSWPPTGSIQLIQSGIAKIAFPIPDIKTKRKILQVAYKE